jgi:hypothetical protein
MGAPFVTPFLEGMTIIRDSGNAGLLPAAEAWSCGFSPFTRISSTGAEAWWARQGLNL